MEQKLGQCDVGNIIGRLETPMQDVCWLCECMQGFLMQLQLDGDQEAAAFTRSLTVPSASLHGCLGCDPCPPADEYAEYIRGKQATLEEDGCGECCG
jgi:hypothetical protein